MRAEEERIDANCLAERSPNSSMQGAIISTLILIWTGVSTLFFFIRFSFLFFAAHQEAIRGLFQRLTGG